MFESYGIIADRLDMPEEGACQNLLDQYNQIDIALDPFPYSGAATTCEALWMGVPVVTCPQKTFAGRQTLSHLSAVGLAELVAEDLTHYEDLAVALVADRDRLAAWRSGLRVQMAASPLCDGAQCARHLMKALRRLWAEWCSSAAK